MFIFKVISYYLFKSLTNTFENFQEILVYYQLFMSIAHA